MLQTLKLSFAKDAFLHRALAEALRGCSDVLDLGCGANSPLGRIDKTFRSVGVDAWAESSVHDRMVRADLRELHVPARSYDAVIGLDVIEHLPRGEGERLLAKMESAARKRVVVFTPNGFLPQRALGGNPFQAHRSGWTPGEFARRGYRITGINGFRFLRGEGAEIRYQPRPLWRRLSCLTQALLHPFPALCFQIFCVKDV